MIWQGNDIGYLPTHANDALRETKSALRSAEGDARIADTAYGLSHEAHSSFPATSGLGACCEKYTMLFAIKSRSAELFLFSYGVHNAACGAWGHHE